MSFFDQLNAQTQSDRLHVTAAPVFDLIEQECFTLPGYVYFLNQAYHHVKHTAPLMMACGSRLPESKELVREALVEYIEEEYGHHEWILNDLEACGEKPESTRSGNADLPIKLMVSYLYNLVDRGNPMGLFGMVHVLEGTSVSVATAAGRAIQRSLGLPDKAFSYLYSHGDLDQDHFAFFKTLMNKVREPEDQLAIIETAKVCYRLYGDMLRDSERHC